MGLSVVILAAGVGTRMQSALPKVLHRIGGLTLLEHVVNTAQSLKADIYVVYGHQGERVKAELKHLPVTWVEQSICLGTGHAVLQALPHIDPQSQVLVLLGDCPLVSEKTLRCLLEKTKPDQIGLVTAEVSDPSGLGRVLHDQTGHVLGVVEHKDASAKQRKINEINTGIIVAPAARLHEWLPNLSNSNAQEEYYLTDIFSLANRDRVQVNSVLAAESEEVLGINDRAQLSVLERYYQRQRANEMMLQGVTLADPARVDFRGICHIGKDTFVDINVIFAGKNHIGEHCHIGPNCFIKDATIGDNVTIDANTVIDSAVIERECKIGPFARLRPGTVLQSNAHVGNFVEIKKTIMGERSKANHLSYLGDARIGKDVNIGAGTITCNYDGVNKFETVIGDAAFIGSNTELVAPVNIGKGATIGAGSTITRNAPDDQLTVARAKQVTIPSWERPKKIDGEEY